MSWLEAELEKAYEIKTQKLGLAKGHKAEGKVLNRLIRKTDGGWEIEADPRHAELVVEQLGLKDDKGIGTPGLSGPMRMTKMTTPHCQDQTSPATGALLPDVTTWQVIGQTATLRSRKVAERWAPQPQDP